MFTKLTGGWQARLFRIALLNGDAVQDEGRRIVSPWFWFIVLCLSYSALVFFQDPWFSSGEMFAEMAVNYFHFAQSPDFSTKYLSTDAGYMPVFQRLIAALAVLLSLPATLIPYFYNGAALVFSLLMAGLFVHPTFRILFQNDGGRFLAALSVLLVPIWENSTFINFTYTGIFSAAVIIARLLVPAAQKPPWWIWTLPLLMLTKPYAIAFFPLLIAGLMLRDKRLRLLFGLSAAALGAQIFRLGMSLHQGIHPHSDTMHAALTFVQKVEAACLYTFAYMGGFFVGPPWLNTFPPQALSGLGIVIILITGWIVFKSEKQATSLFVVGITTVFGTFALNAFALTKFYHVDAFIKGAEALTFSLD
ncbi:MAG: hypothetical protein QGI45_06585, partial [Myxococcota bacterium]|nr:hypothetical protein [Myxococcota bacterium]